MKSSSHMQKFGYDTHSQTHTHVIPTPTALHHTQAAFPALNGCRDRGVMASLWADVQLGMLDVQAGIPGKAKNSGKGMLH